MGNEILYKGFTYEHMKTLITTFVKYKECKFIVKVEGKSLIRLSDIIISLMGKDKVKLSYIDPSYFEHENIYFYEGTLDIDEIL
uniref:CRISPR-associated endonuclease Cas1 n=1 Tax=Meloidogyne hapla TaxID=6305 RepID=A0A1I8BNT8_MELHA